MRQRRERTLKFQPMEVLNRVLSASLLCLGHTMQRCKRFQYQFFDMVTVTVESQLMWCAQKIGTEGSSKLIRVIGSFYPGVLNGTSIRSRE
jgi:hypothetical protein